MAKLPTVAIIGRPNTGKSTLFNRLINERKSIESEIAGTTRDLVSKRIDTSGVSYLLVDTGGIGSTADKDFEKDVAGQSQLAVEFADVIVFTVNSREEITNDDRTVVDIIRKKRKRHVPVIVAITKADDPRKLEHAILDYQELNIGEEIVAVSAPHMHGIHELEDAIVRQLKKLNFGPVEKEDDENRPPKIAIIGKPNVGKSSIVNALMTDVQRETAPLLVSPIAGTTRDSVDTEVTYHGKTYILIDTAGLKKNSQTDDDIERYAAMRTVTSVEEADVVILVLNAAEQPSQQDKRIASMAEESGKGLIILLNKIDTMKGEKRTQATEFVTDALRFVTKFARIIPCSAVTREGLVKLFDLVESVQQSRVRRISTRDLRRWFEDVVHGQPLGEVAKAKHITQAKDIPPTFVLFVKNPKRVSVSQLRYLENRLRETFGFDGTPIRWITKGGEEEEPKRKLKR